MLGFRYVFYQAKTTFVMRYLRNPWPDSRKTLHSVIFKKNLLGFTLQYFGYTQSEERLKNPIIMTL
jgi:hypothetical protein